MRYSLWEDLLVGKKYPMDLLIVIIWSIISVICIFLLPDGNPLRVFFGVLIVIFLPGYVIVSILWPGRTIKENHDELKKPQKSEDMKENKELSSWREIDNLLRIALSFGLSIAIVPLIGLVLNLVWEMSLVPIVTCLFGFILVSVILAWYRRRNLPEEERFFVSFAIKLKPVSYKWTQADKALVSILIISLIIIGSIVVYVIVIPSEEEKFTKLYYLDQNHTLEDLPTNLTVNETGIMIIGVVCHEYGMTEYDVVIVLFNTTGERQNRTLWVYNITLEHMEQNETVYSFQINESGEYKLKIELYKRGINMLYRAVYLWVTVKTS